jgi:hypothetical protein
VGAPAPSTVRWLITTLAAGWAPAESLGVSIMHVLLTAFCYRAASGLLEGAPPSWSFVHDTANRTLELIVSTVLSLQ